MKTLSVVSYGLGPIGLAAADLAARKQSLRLVGAVDIDPTKRGKDLGELLGRDKPVGVVVEDDAEAVLARRRPDAILHCTGSFLPDVVDQLIACARAGANVVSSAEELLVPDLRHPEHAARLDEAAKEGGATVLGTGVNPGFVMDFLAAVASAVCHDVRAVRCERVVDAGTRRLPLQRKVGAGLSPERFEDLAATGRFGHAGLRESVALVGRALGFELDTIRQSLDPVLAEEPHRTPFLTVEPGQVAGIHNVGIGEAGGRRLVELDLQMYVGAPDPHDRIVLDATPPVDLRFEGGIPGDAATAAILVNSLPGVVAAPPGLATVLDVVPPHLVR